MKLPPKIENEIIADGLDNHFIAHILIGLENDGSTVAVSFNGEHKDLVNTIAVACDDEELREVLYDSIVVDLIHDKTVGRKP